MNIKKAFAIFTIAATPLLFAGCGRGSAAPTSGPPAPLIHVYTDGTIIEAATGTAHLPHATNTQETTP